MADRDMVFVASTNWEELGRGLAIVNTLVRHARRQLAKDSPVMATMDQVGEMTEQIQEMWWIIGQAQTDEDMRRIDQEAAADSSPDSG